MGKITHETIINFTTDPSALPGNLTGLKKRFSQKDVTTQYATNNGTALAVDLSFVSIVRMMAGLDPVHEVYIGKTKNGYVTEIRSITGNIDQIASVEKSKDGWKVSACEINKTTGVSSPYNKDETRKGTLIKVALMPVFQLDEEFRTAYEQVLNYTQTKPDDSIWVDDPSMLEGFGKALCVLSNNAYYRTRYASNCGMAGVTFSGINVLRQNDIKALRAASDVCGTSVYFVKEAPKAKAAKGSDLVGKFSILTRKLTDAEKALVPIMDDWFITPSWVETEAKVIQASKVFPIPFRSLLLYGVSGTGKTEGARAIFSALGLPAVSICCSVDMTMFDFLGQMIPNVRKYGQKTTEEVSTKLGIPTFDDVENDFADTYRQLFGTEPDALASPSDCYQKICELMMASKSDGEADFVYTESAFVKAYKNGWGLEIQEPTIIKRNSVLAGLNQALDNDPKAASITLPTGEVIRRHPDFCVIMTTNQDYDGCNNIQQSVLSRMQNKRHIANPTQDELVSRTISETKFPDKNVLKTMAAIIQEMNEFCNKADVTDGVCGPRELSNWAKRAYIEAIIGEGDDKLKTVDNAYVLKAAFPTVIEKVSQVSEDREQAIIEVIQKHFSENDVMVARDEYMEGVA